MEHSPLFPCYVNSGDGAAKKKKKKKKKKEEGRKADMRWRWSGRREGQCGVSGGSGGGRRWLRQEERRRRKSAGEKERGQRQLLVAERFTAVELMEERPVVDGTAVMDGGGMAVLLSLLLLPLFLFFFSVSSSVSHGAGLLQ